MLPEAFLNELKYNTDIEQVIGRYVQLRRRAKNLTGLCPFHSEKTPSFTVYPDTQSFYCFGCGAGGDAITFMKKIENLDYMEAVRSLAERAGMAVPEGAVDDGSRQRKARILELNRAAARHFHQNLMAQRGREARKYLVDRGLTKATVVRFGIGYAPESWDDLRDHLREKGFTDEEMIAAALVSPGKKGGCYDAFRNRIIFPIIDLRGGVIAFGGRNLSDQGPKYLNSGDTPVFKKSRNLFALNFAKDTKRPELILCEGYMDVVSVHQGGFDNAVATLGTALTPEQARLISNYTDTVVLSYDSDGPGQQATRRAISIFEDTGVKVRVLSIPDAKDPDEFLKKFGPERFALLLEGSSGAMDFEVEKLRKKYDTDIPEGRVGFLQEFVRLLAGLSSPIQREVYLSKVCRELEVDKQAVAHQLEGAIPPPPEGRAGKAGRQGTAALYRPPGLGQNRFGKAEISPVRPGGGAAHRLPHPQPQRLGLGQPGDCPGGVYLPQGPGDLRSGGGAAFPGAYRRYDEPFRGADGGKPGAPFGDSGLPRVREYFRQGGGRLHRYAEKFLYTENQRGSGQYGGGGFWPLHSLHCR